MFTYLRDNVYHVSPMWMWTDPTIDDKIRAFNRTMIAKLKKTGGNKDGVTQYNNYASENSHTASYMCKGTNKHRR